MLTPLLNLLRLLDRIGTLTPAWARGALAGLLGVTALQAESFRGRFFQGEGDVEYLRCLDISRRMFAPDPEWQNVAMLYTPAWNGFVEGPTWGAWWIQNSYGPTWCVLPLLEEPLVTFLQNAQDLWFDQMGDGQRRWKWQDQELVIPDGQLCDAAAPGWFIPKQGDGRVGIHDWGVEFTAAGLLMQAELLLIGRDTNALAHYLPRLRRCADFLETRRDPANHLFLAGPAGNLLAPSYAGWHKPDGTYGQAYLAGLSVTYIAALDRLIELERLGGTPARAEQYLQRRDLARQGLPRLTTDEGYFIKYLDPDGTRHGVWGAPKHGYFEAVVNHDAICFRVVDDAQAERIYRQIAAIPELRPHDVILTNCRGLDDMYEPPTSWLWKFGTWVNGGHWSTCEARMIMAYYRLGQYEDARRSFRQLLKFARAFRMDNPLVDFGAAVYQPNEPINLCYDSFGPPAAMIRGLFEYLYRADSLTLIPHVPPGITRLEQHFPVRFGRKRLFLATSGVGPISAVSVNGQAWAHHDARSITLPYDRVPEEAVIQVRLGTAPAWDFQPRRQPLAPPAAAPLEPWVARLDLVSLISTNELPLRIGADSDGGNRFHGRIAQARIYSRALSPAEIRTRAADPLAATEPETALVGDWRPDPASGRATNRAGAGLDARAVGPSTTVNTDRGPALEFPGDGYFEVPHDARLNLASGGTLEAWICPKAHGPGGARILDKSRVGTSNGYLLDTHPGNSLRLITEAGALGFDAQLKPDVWVHVAATIDDRGRLALYLDGREVAHQEPKSPADVAALDARTAPVRRFLARLIALDLGHVYEAAHARLVLEFHAAARERFDLATQGKLERLPDRSQRAADLSYLQTLARLTEGLEKTLAGYRNAPDPHRRHMHALWNSP